MSTASLAPTVKIATRMGESWGPWHGCSGWPRSPGCANCYAVVRQMPRYKRYRGHETEVKVGIRQTFNKPLYWTQENPKMIFVTPWSDFFSDDAEADKWRPLAWKIMHQTWWHTYRIRTKYAEHIEDSLPDDWGTTGYENVWLGVSVENQDYTWRIDYLRNIPAKLKWVSAEPLLGPLDLTSYLKSVPLGWVITGGESGDSKHPPRLDEDLDKWFLDLAQQCRTVGVPFMVKQRGGTKKCTCHRDKNPTAPNSSPHEAAYGCRIIKGQTFDQFPT